MPDTHATVYRPTPADTSSVVLSAELSEALEQLARNIHELWAARRVSEGWVAGAQRDDGRRIHPCLVPFEQLPASEQAYDRSIAGETLKFLLQKGFHISKG